MCFSREYKLFSPSGMEVTLLDAGASLVGVYMPDRDGVFANVALPLKEICDPSLAGTTLAPFAGRIAKGQMEIDGKMHQLSLNEGKNHLHGGFEALSHKRWHCDGRSEECDYQEVSFSATAADGVDGYPGNRRFTVTYRLWHDQRLEILLTAVTDKPTRVNLSNHAYFNLTGDFSKDVSKHMLHMHADEVYLNDEAFLMNDRGYPPSVLDFGESRCIGKPEGHPQVNTARGLNHCYVLHRQDALPAAVLSDPVSGRRMRLYTDQPCVMVYSGGFLDHPNCAIALEAQGHPYCACAPESDVLYPEQIYKRSIVYQFDVCPDAKGE